MAQKTALKSERELGSQKAIYDRAKEAARSKNYDYAIDLIQRVLKAEPLFLDGRRLLRKVAIEKVRNQKAGLFGMKSGVNIGAMTKLNGIAKKTPQEQLEIAEEILKDDPFSEAANQVVADAGEALGELEFKSFAQESVVEGKPNDKKALFKLAQIYLDNREFIKAEKTYETILAHYPTDGEAKSGLKQASAAQSYRENLEGKETDYRKSLKNESEAIELENKSKVIKSGEALDALIAAANAKFEKEPKNLNHPKEIARLLEQKGDLDASIQWYNYAYEMGGSIDSALETTVSELKLKQIEVQIRSARDRMAEGSPEEQAVAQQEMQQWEQARKQYNLENAQKMVRKYPQDGEYRYNLGKALYEVGQFRPGLQELQQSLKQPSVRYQALKIMGQSYMALKMYDFAIKTLVMASGELVGMDDLKKDIVYILARAYDASGQKDKGLDEDKKIYEVDITYRDVADRVEGSYGG